MTKYTCLLYEEGKGSDEFYVPQAHLETEDIVVLDEHKRHIGKGEIHIVQVIEDIEGNEVHVFLDLDKAIAKGRRL